MDNQQPSNNIFYRRPQEGKGFIYMYTSPSGRHYIGQTINSLAERARSPVSGKGYKKCILFWKAIEKYHFSNFQVEILEEAEIEKLNDLEKRYIKEYNSLAPNGYNISNGGDGGKKVEVFVYSAQNGKFLEHYNSLSEASLFTGVPIETISSILSNKNQRKIAHNLYFSKTFLKEIDLLTLARKNYTTIYLYDIEGTFIKALPTIRSAASELRVSESAINRHCANGKECCGYYLSKEKLDRMIPKEKNEKRGLMVRQIDPNTLLTIQIFPSLSSAAKAVGLSSSAAISAAIKEGKKSKGFFWKLIEGSTTMCPENSPGPVRGISKEMKI